MFGLGAAEIIVVLVIALLVFGPKKLPDLAKGIGKALREFRRASSDLQEQLSVDAELGDAVREVQSAATGAPLPADTAKGRRQLEEDPYAADPVPVASGAPGPGSDPVPVGAAATDAKSPSGTSPGSDPVPVGAAATPGDAEPAAAADHGAEPATTDPPSVGPTGATPDPAAKAHDPSTPPDEAAPRRPAPPAPGKPAD